MMTTKLSEIISVLESGSRPKGGVKEGYEGIPSLGGEHLSKEGGFNFSKLKMISHDFFSKMKRGKIAIGDILIVKDGATTGKVAIVRKDFPFKEAAINEHLFRIRVDPDKAVQEYIFRYLQSPLGQLQIMSSFRGAAIGGINTSFVERVSLYLPSIDEQKRIVDILAKASDIHRNSKFVASLQNILVSNVFLEMFGDPRVNDKNWPTKPLIEVATLQRGFDLPVQNRVPGLVPILASNGPVGYHNESKVIGPGVVTGRSGSLGHVQYVDQDYWPLNTSLWVKNFHGNDPRWIAHLLRNMNLQNFTRGSGVPTLNRNLVHVVEVIHPPVELQKKFADYEISIQSIFEPIITSSQKSFTLLSGIIQEMLT